VTPELRARVAGYGDSHRTPVNRLLHIVGIPLLGVGSLGILCQLAVPVGAGAAALEPNVGQLALLVALGWYLYYGRWSALPAFLLVVFCYAVGSVLSAWVLVGLWLAGALLHVIGHYGFEGKTPATFRDPRSILEAPIWLLCLLTGTLPDGEATRPVPG
jgi:uncharacterized membrane protein YGL010W